MDIHTKMSKLVFIYIYIMTLSLLSWNIRGLTHDCRGITSTIPGDVDVIAVQEHWLNPDNVYRLNEIHGYSTITSKCNLTTSSRGAGGVAIMRSSKSIWRMRSIATTSEFFVAACIYANGNCSIIDEYSYVTSDHLVTLK